MLSSKRSFAAVLCLALTSSCVVPGHVRAVKTADRLDELSAAIGELRASVTAASTALANLVAKKDQDAPAAFDQFEDSVSALESARHHLDARILGVHDEADEYFLTWKQQAATIEDEDLKESSESRRQELAKAIERVEEHAKPAREAVDTFLTSLHDTQKYLSIDLSPAAVGSLDGRVKSASKAAKSINEKLDDLLEAVKGTAPLFASQRPAAPKKAAPDAQN